MHGFDDATDVGAVAHLIVGAYFLYGLVLMDGCPADEVSFLHHAKRADESNWKLAHDEFGGHCGECTIEGEVHEGSAEDVVLVVTESYLIATQLLRERE